MINPISIIFDIVSFLIFIGVILGAFYVFLIFAKQHYKKKNKTKDVKLIEVSQSIIKRVASAFLSCFTMFATMGISVILAIGVKPIIFKLNYPIGEGYATFASYIVAICLYILFSSLRTKTNNSEENERR